MSEHSILFPICGTLYPYRMSHRAFWLARYLPARLWLMEVLLPTDWFRWLLSFFSRKDREYRLREVERMVFQRDGVECRTDTLKAPNLTVGIVEAAWKVKPNFIVLMPELQHALGKVGLRDLKTRLGEMSRCTLVLLGHGPTITLEPCTTTNASDRGQIVSVDFI
jgi:hypothetical protein